MRRWRFFPLVVTGIWSYLKCCVFMTGSFSTELSAAAAGAVDCASSVAAPSATSDGIRRPRSLREHFMTGSFFGPPEGGLFGAAQKAARDHREFVDRLRVVPYAVRRDEFFSVGSERAAADDIECPLVRPGERDADHAARRRNHAEIRASAIEHLHAWRRRHIETTVAV